MIGIADVADAEGGRVGFKRFELRGAFAVGDGHARTLGIAADGGRQIVIGHREGEIGTAHLAPGKAQRLERLRAGHFMDEVAVDVDKAGPICRDPRQRGRPRSFRRAFSRCCSWLGR
jgi:hypothetical protein